MNCVIISIGDELLAGRTVDTNSTFLSGSLKRMGISTSLKITVPDQPEAIEEALLQAFNTADLVITTGGLGPTCDDKTRRVIADFFNLSLNLDEEILKKIEEKFARRGIPMPEDVRSEAMVPEGFIPLANNEGIAPGLFYKTPKEKNLLVLPGVPGELKYIFTISFQEILNSFDCVETFETRRFFTTGITESNLYDIIKNTLCDFDMSNVAFYPSTLGVEINLHMKKGDENDFIKEKLIADACQQWCYSRKHKNIVYSIAEILKERALSVAAAESCTGGLLSSRLVDIPGASGWFYGGVVAYSNDIKTEMLGVKEESLIKHGAVSAQVAAEMAIGAAQRMNSDFGLSTTGIAGPSGGTESKPVGTVYIGVHTPNGTSVRKYRFMGSRGFHRERSSQAALWMLYLHLTDNYYNHNWGEGSTQEDFNA